MAYRLALPRRAALVPPLGMCCSGLHGCKFFSVPRHPTDNVRRFLSYSSQANWLLGFGFCSFVRCHLVSRRGCRVCLPTSCSRLECCSHSTTSYYVGQDIHDWLRVRRVPDTGARQWVSTIVV